VEAIVKYFGMRHGRKMWR